MDNLKKITKNLPTGMEDELNAMDFKELKERIGKSATIIAETRAQLSEDPDVVQAKDALKNLQEPYKETIKAQDAVIKYSVFLLKEKGKL